MTKQTLIMGLLTGLLGFFGCNNKATDKTSQGDTSKVVTMNPNDILFTTSTLNALPDFKEKTDTCAFFTKMNGGKLSLSLKTKLFQ